MEPARLRVSDEERHQVAELLRPGGAMGIAWNVKVAGRPAALEILAGAGLDPLDDGPYLALEHRVDHSIRRDILVARKS